MLHTYTRTTRLMRKHLLICVTWIQVMIYRLITRGTIEERMMQLTKKKMILEHLVVGRLKAQQTVNQVHSSSPPN